MNETNQKKKISESNLKKINDVLTGKFGENQSSMARALGITPQSVQGWLKNKKGISVDLMDMISKWSMEMAVGGEIIEIPRFDVTASMGPGFEQPEDDRVVELLRVSASWLSMNVPGVSPHRLAIITARGDSMEGTFRDGDFLLVDTGAIDASSDAIYVFAMRAQIYVKRLQNMPDGSLLVISDNPKYREFTVKEEAEGFRVLGRIVFAWSGRRM